MTIEQQISELTTATTQLLDAVIVSKGDLDQKVTAATNAADFAREKAQLVADAVGAASSAAATATAKAEDAGLLATQAQSSATAAAAALVSTEAARDTALAISTGSVKTINGNSIIGTGNIELTLIPPGAMIIGKVGASIPGFLQCDGSIFDGNSYPGLVAFSSPLQVIAGGNLVPGSSIFASSNSVLDPNRGPSVAFDGLTGGHDNHWHSSYSYQPYLQAEFTDYARTITAYRIYGRWDGYNISNWILYGSNDGDSWNMVDDRSSEPSIPDGGSMSFGVANPGSYKFYRIQAQNQMYHVIVELQLYENATTETRYQLPTSNKVSWLESGFSYFIKY